MSELEGHEPGNFRFVTARFNHWTTTSQTARLYFFFFLVFQYFFLPNAAYNVYYQPIRNNFEQWKMSVSKLQQKTNHFKINP